MQLSEVARRRPALRGPCFKGGFGCSLVAHAPAAHDASLADFIECRRTRKSLSGHQVALSYLACKA